MPVPLDRSARGIRSEFAACGQPDAVEGQIRLLKNQVVVAVVVQNPDAVNVGDRREQQVNRRKPMVSDARQLLLRRERSPFDVAIDRDEREREQLVNQFSVLWSVACAVACFEQEREADGDAALLDPSRYLLCSLLGQAWLVESRPGRVIDEQLRAQALELDLCAEDDQLAELDAIGLKLAAQLSSAAWTDAVSVIAWRRRLVGLDPGVAPVRHLFARRPRNVSEQLSYDVPARDEVRAAFGRELHLSLLSGRGRRPLGAGPGGSGRAPA